MSTTHRFYQVIDIPTPDFSVLAAFEQLPHDPFTPGGQRSRRFSQFRMTFDKSVDSWQLERLPYRPFIQSKVVNSLVGGIQRPFEPLLVDFSAQVAAGGTALGLDEARAWQINVHQCRVVSTPDIKGVSVPEGPHRDGHDFGMLAVFSRHNITGGTNRLMPAGGGDPFFEVTLQPNQALVYDDGAMWHTATDIEALDDSGGYRDLCIIAINDWDRRKYGEEFEREAAAGRPREAVPAVAPEP
jgi:hypothetical protein